ncbi:hypothetical protein LRR18_18375, partial [Mangrovimonas sp. AS39]|uniref:hypothetical protein n=1 Tax=Mangrovimonas futianensis TaxID=2895523 RepID=UPI001E5C822B
IILNNPTQLDYPSFKKALSPETINTVAETSDEVKRLLSTTSTTKKRAIAEALEIPVENLTKEEITSKVLFGKYTDLLNKTSEFSPGRTIFEIAK